MENKFSSLESVLRKSWVRFTYGRNQFFFNPVTNRSVWDKPDHYVVEIPYILHVLSREKIQPTRWEFILLNNNKFFFFDTEHYRSSWNVPVEVRNLYNVYLKAKIEVKSPTNVLRRPNVIEMKVDFDDSDEEEEEEDSDSDSSDDEFEIIDTESGEVVSANIGNEQDGEDDEPIITIEEETTDRKITGKRKRSPDLPPTHHQNIIPPVIIDEEERSEIQKIEPKKKKRKVQVSRVIQSFNEMLDEVNITEDMTYQQFFRKKLRDVRFRNIHSNEKRKELFHAKIEKLKKSKSSNLIN